MDQSLDIYTESLAKKKKKCRSAMPVHKQLFYNNVQVKSCREHINKLQGHLFERVDVNELMFYKFNKL